MFNSIAFSMRRTGLNAWIHRTSLRSITSVANNSTNRLHMRSVRSSAATKPKSSVHNNDDHHQFTVDRGATAIKKEVNHSKTTTHSNSNSNSNSISNSNSNSNNKSKTANTTDTNDANTIDSAKVNHARPRSSHAHSTPTENASANHSTTAATKSNTAATKGNTAATKSNNHHEERKQVITAQSSGDRYLAHIMCGKSLQEFVVDENTRTGRGPKVLEYLLGSMAGCTQVTAYYVASHMHPPFRMDRMIVNVEGEFDKRGFQGQEGIPAHMQAVRIKVGCATEEFPERIEDLRKRVERQCPVHSLFNAAGVKLESEWERIKPHYG